MGTKHPPGSPRQLAGLPQPLRFPPPVGIAATPATTTAVATRRPVPVTQPTAAGSITLSASAAIFPADAPCQPSFGAGVAAATTADAYASTEAHAVKRTVAISETRRDGDAMNLTLRGPRPAEHPRNGGFGIFGVDSFQAFPGVPRLEVELTFTDEFEYHKTLDYLVHQVCAAVTGNLAEIHWLSQAANEAVGFALGRSRGPGGHETVSAAIRLEGQSVELRVSYTGVPVEIPTNSVFDVQAYEKRGEVGDLRIYILRKVADSLDFRREGNKNVIVIRRKLREATAG